MTLQDRVVAPDFSWITDQMAVGGRIVPEHLPDMAATHGISAVIDLRLEDKDDEVLLQRHGIALLHLPTEDKCGVDEARLEDGVEMACRWLDQGRKVLVHCEHGIGRSATLALCVMVARGWSPLDALRLMKNQRESVSPSPAQFKSWTHWLELHRSRCAVAWKVPRFDEFEQIAYRPLRSEH